MSQIEIQVSKKSEMPAFQGKRVSKQNVTIVQFYGKNFVYIYSWENIGW